MGHLYATPIMERFRQALELGTHDQHSANVRVRQNVNRVTVLPTKQKQYVNKLHNGAP